MRDTLLAATMAPSLLRSGAAAVLRSSCADTQHRHTPSVRLQGSSVELAAVCYSRGWRKKEWSKHWTDRERGLKGRQTRPLSLSIVTGNGAPRTRGGETGGATSPFIVIVLIIPLLGFKQNLWETRVSSARRSFFSRCDFLRFNLVNWPPRQPDPPLSFFSTRTHTPPSQPLYGPLPNLLFFQACPLHA